MSLPPTIEIDVLTTFLCRLDDELMSLDMDYSLRKQYRFTVRKYLQETAEGRILQALVDRSPQPNLEGEIARTALNRLITSIPLVSGEETSRHYHGEDMNLIHTSPDLFGPPCTCQLPSSMSTSSAEMPTSLRRASCRRCFPNANESTIEFQRDENMENQLLQHLTIEDQQLRPCAVALCCAILFEIWKQSGSRYEHLARGGAAQALMRTLYTFPSQDLSIYITGDPSEFSRVANIVEAADVYDRKREIADVKCKDLPQLPSLCDCLSAVPFSSVVRTLEPQVEELIKQRRMLEEAQRNAIARREARRRAIPEEVDIVILPRVPTNLLSPARYHTDKARISPWGLSPSPNLAERLNWSGSEVPFESNHLTSPILSLSSGKVPHTETIIAPCAEDNIVPESNLPGVDTWFPSFLFNQH